MGEWKRASVILESIKVDLVSIMKVSLRPAPRGLGAPRLSHVGGVGYGPTGCIGALRNTPHLDEAVNNASGSSITNLIGPQPRLVKNALAPDGLKRRVLKR